MSFLQIRQGWQGETVSSDDDNSYDAGDEVHG